MKCTSKVVSNFLGCTLYGMQQSFSTVLFYAYYIIPLPLQYGHAKLPPRGKNFVPLQKWHRIIDSQRACCIISAKQSFSFSSLVRFLGSNCPSSSNIRANSSGDNSCIFTSIYFCSTLGTEPCTMNDRPALRTCFSNILFGSNIFTSLNSFLG